MTSLDVIIVNWNAGRKLEACIASISRARRDGVELRRIVVVDNASADGSADGLGGAPLPLAVIRNEGNRGFAAACNQGAAGSGADYLLFLNPDTELFPDSLAAPVAFMERDTERRYGVLGVRLVDGEGRTHRSCARFLTPPRALSRSLGLDRLAPRIFPGYFMTEWDHAESREVDHVSGAFYLVRRGIFEKLGGFDERFFVYLEDMDFSRRLRAAGFASFFLAEAAAYHEGGGASERDTGARFYYSVASRVSYGFKHFPPAAAWGLAAVAICVEPPVRVLYSLFDGNAGSALRGVRMLYGALPRIIKGTGVNG